ncbi:MAG: hypothetical protein LBH62_06470 [Nitrososphaerota archaeon]|nr:hypothetical protein [Nitrososphaerota archaeon]
MSTIVAADGRYVGAGSKQTTLSGSGIVIVKVTPNVPSGDYHKTAIIENLIIDGKNPATNGISAGSVGILLQNVYNCVIRNVTILNCEVGIKIENTNNYWSQSNRIEHVRMTNVKTGILFTAAGTNGDFGFTTINDVGIKLNSETNDDPDTTTERVGIQIGTAQGPVVKPYSSFIKATIWLGNYRDGCGMKVYGELKYSLVMLAVESPEHKGGTKIGVKIENPVSMAVYNNQSFMLSYGTNVGTITTPPLFILHDIVTKPIG